MTVANAGPELDFLCHPPLLADLLQRPIRPTKPKGPRPPPRAAAPAHTPAPPARQSSGVGASLRAARLMALLAGKPSEAYAFAAGQEPTPDDLSHCPALPELITATVASRPDQPDPRRRALCVLPRLGDWTQRPSTLRPRAPPKCDGFVAVATALPEDEAEAAEGEAVAGHTPCPPRQPRLPASSPKRSGPRPGRAYKFLPLADQLSESPALAA
eukprot:EG_transcript_15947